MTEITHISILILVLGLKLEFITVLILAIYPQVQRLHLFLVVQKDILILLIVIELLLVRLLLIQVQRKKVALPTFPIVPMRLLFLLALEQGQNYKMRRLVFTQLEVIQIQHQIIMCVFMVLL